VDEFETFYCATRWERWYSANRIVTVQPSDTAAPVETPIEIVPEKFNEVGDAFVLEFDPASRNLFVTSDFGVLLIHPDGSAIRTGVNSVLRSSAVTADGRLYVVRRLPAGFEAGFELVRIDPRGHAVPVLDLTPVGWQARLTADPFGGVYVTRAGPGNDLHISPNGRIREIDLSYFELGGQNGAAVDAWGNLHVAIGGNVIRVDPACADGLDNDHDGLVDHPADPGCGSPRDPFEDPECDDGIDNDGDGFIDAARDGCVLPSLHRECGLGFEIALMLPILARLRRARRPKASTRAI
jgi:hypothetical protein